jgi:asparagine synthase (glutamine-hydrolysing)
VCGFVGYFRLASADGPPFDANLLSMSRLLAHRGPDDHDVMTEARCGMAHQRLSVLDLSRRGRQPMTTEDGRVTVAYNGEIYNFRELWQQHGSGPPLKSRTDTEVLLRLSQAHGTKRCLQWIDGMYAFAVYDRTLQRLELARDPFGVKPLFTLEHDGVLWFASEIGPLLKVPGFVPRPCMEALHHFLSFDYIPGALTAFAGIRELRPGHRLVATAAGGLVSNAPFLSLDYTVDDSIDLRTAVDQTGVLLEAAVRRQLVADVPVGVMLSGGLDSSALVAMARRVHPDAPLHTYAIGFDDPTYDESNDAAAVAAHFHTTHHAVRVTAADVLANLKAHLSHIDEPFADGSALPTFLLAQRAQQDVTVLLSGEGGDEIFSGYDTHAAAVARRWYRWIPGPLRRGCIAPLAAALPVSHKKLSLDFKAKRFVAGAELDGPQSHHFWRMVLSEDAKAELLLNPDKFSDFPPSNQLFIDAWNEAGDVGPLNRLLHIDMHYHLPDDLMVKNDRMTMAHGLEARVPFCDLELVRFLHSVSPSLKMRGLRGKHLLRSALAADVPKRTLTKKKIGLEMPYSRWIRDELRELVMDTLDPQRLAATGLFDPAAVQRLIDDHQEMKVDNGRAIWGLLSYVQWHALYIETSDFENHLVAPRAPVAAGG